MRGNWLGFPSFQCATFWLVPLVTPSRAFGSIPGTGHRVRFSDRLLSGSPGLEDAIAVAQHGALVLRGGENEKGPSEVEVFAATRCRQSEIDGETALQPGNLLTSVSRPVSDRKPRRVWPRTGAHFARNFGTRDIVSTGSDLARARD